ncbi:MAG: methyltransferase [Delftia acidovorans]|nr:MAG: methyltransferase [Delftia acidovorans]
MSSQDWSAGYVTDTTYTYGYYQELNPVRARLALLLAGYEAAKPVHACELGFGQGVSIAVHATGSDCQWSGTDFNPSQALHAKMLAASSGAEADLRDESFAEFASRSDLPEFDFIGLHGIWTWISDENRSVIVDFVRRKLKVGGVLFISYNTLPGWAAAAPLRHLMAEVGATLAPQSGGSAARVEGALSFVDRFLNTDPQYLQANPKMKDRFEGIKKQNRAYLAHEYFNRDWHPMFFADMARWLAPAKLTFGASASLVDGVDILNLTSEQQAILAELSDPLSRQSLRDFCVNQQFRKDLWTRGARRLTALEQLESLRDQRLVLSKIRSTVPMSVTTVIGKADLSEAVYTPLLDLMADHKIRSFSEIESALRHSVAVGQLVQAITILTGTGVLAPAQDARSVQIAKKKTDRLNAHLMNRARGSGDVAYLASPVTGGAVPVARFPQLFCQAIKNGRKATDDWVNFVWSILDSQGQKIVKDGILLETEQQNRDELSAQASEFSTNQLPVLKALEII